MLTTISSEFGSGAEQRSTLVLVVQLLGTSTLIIHFQIVNLTVTFLYLIRFRAYTT